MFFFLFPTPFGSREVFLPPPRFSYHSLYLLPVLLFGFSNASYTFEPTANSLAPGSLMKFFNQFNHQHYLIAPGLINVFFWKIILRIFSSRQFLSLTTNQQHYRTAAGFPYMRISFPGAHFQLRFIHKPLHYHTASGF